MKQWKNLNSIQNSESPGVKSKGFIMLWSRNGMTDGTVDNKIKFSPFRCSVSGKVLIMMP